MSARRLLETLLPEISVTPEGTGTRIDAHIDGENVGYAVLYPQGKSLFLDGLRVEPKRQRQGIASTLMRAVVQHCGDRQITLRPRPFEDEAMDEAHLRLFYSRFGFVPEGIYMVRRANLSVP